MDEENIQNNGVDVDTENQELDNTNQEENNQENGAGNSQQQKKEPDYDFLDEQPKPAQSQDDDEEVDEDEKKFMSKVEQKVLAPVKAEMEALKKTNAINEFLNSENGQQFAEYREAMMKLAQKAEFSKFKPKALAYLVAGDNLFAMGVKAAQNSMRQAKASGTPGAFSPKQSNGKLNPSDMRNWTPAQVKEFEQGLKEGKVSIFGK